MAFGVGYNGIYDQNAILKWNGTEWQKVKMSSLASTTNWDTYWVQPTGSPTSGWQTMGNDTQVNEMMGGTQIYNTGGGAADGRWILITFGGGSGNTIRGTESQIGPIEISSTWYDLEFAAWSGGSGEDCVTVLHSNGTLSDSTDVNSVATDASQAGNVLLPEMDSQAYYFVAESNSEDMFIATAWCDGTVIM